VAGAKANHLDAERSTDRALDFEQVTHGGPNARDVQYHADHVEHHAARLVHLHLIDSL
jgi:hypothetical protein